MKIWEIVKSIEDANMAPEIGELADAKATMIVNFGKKGKCNAGLIDEKDKITNMIMDVFTFYDNKLKQYNHAIHSDGECNFK